MFLIRQREAEARNQVETEESDADAFSKRAKVVGAARVKQALHHTRPLLSNPEDDAYLWSHDGCGGYGHHLYMLFVIVSS
jgi:hypothetical protein